MSEKDNAMTNLNCEPSLEPVEDKYVMADCQHEVFGGEIMVEWDSHTLCPDCFWDKIKEMSIEEVADLLTLVYERVTF